MLDSKLEGDAAGSVLANYVAALCMRVGTVKAKALEESIYAHRQTLRGIETTMFILLAGIMYLYIEETTIGWIMSWTGFLFVGIFFVNHMLRFLGSCWAVATKKDSLEKIWERRKKHISRRIDLLLMSPDYAVGKMFFYFGFLFLGILLFKMVSKVAYGLN